MIACHAIDSDSNSDLGVTALFSGFFVQNYIIHPVDTERPFGDIPVTDVTGGYQQAGKNPEKIVVTHERGVDPLRKNFR